MNKDTNFGATKKELVQHWCNILVFLILSITFYFFSCTYKVLIYNKCKK
jgi:hypothetical protein